MLQITLIIENQIIILILILMLNWILILTKII